MPVAQTAAQLTIPADAETAAEDRAFLQTKEVPEVGASAGTPVGLVDLFCGCGGLTYGALEGLRRAGRSGELKLAVDSDPVPLEVLRATLAVDEAYVREADLARVETVGTDASPFEATLFGAVEHGGVLLAGPPCQGHSALNNHTRHDDPRNDLYFAVARVAELTHPKAVITENVGAVSSDRRATAARCADLLRWLGYQVAPKRIDLRLLGVPQRRVRHVMVATRDARFDWEALEDCETRSVEWAIADLLDREGTGLFDTASVPSAKNRERIDWLFAEGKFNLPDSLRPPCHSDGGHTYRSMYGRLRWDEPAQTITSGFGSMGQGRFVHPLRRRTLTPHEAARLQCLPDFVEFDSDSLTRTALSTMIGNVAPPLLATRIIEALVAQRLL